MFFVNPDDLPPEVKAQMDQAEMAADSYRHDATRFLTELSEDQLVTFRNMMHNLVFEESGKLAAYYEGMAGAFANLRFNICPSCGVNHDKEAAGFHSEDQSNLARETIGEYQDAASKQTDNAQSMLPSFDLSEEDLQHMKKYHLDDVRDADNHQIIAFRCTGVNNIPCGMTYPSIEDRMLREPDECSGCQTKAMWG